MSKVREYVGLSVLGILTGILLSLALLAITGCATTAEPPAKPLPVQTCEDQIKTRKDQNFKDGFIIESEQPLVDAKLGTVGVLAVFTREDNVVRVEALVIKSYREPPPEMNLKPGGDCTFQGKLYKSYRGEAVVTGDRA